MLNHPQPHNLCDAQAVVRALAHSAGAGNRQAQADADEFNSGGDDRSSAATWADSSTTTGVWETASLGRAASGSIRSAYHSARGSSVAGGSAAASTAGSSIAAASQRGQAPAQTQDAGAGDGSEEAWHELSTGGGDSPRSVGSFASAAGSFHSAASSGGSFTSAGSRATTATTGTEAAGSAGHGSAAVAAAAAALPSSALDMFGASAAGTPAAGGGGTRVFQQSALYRSTSAGQHPRAFAPPAEES
jgi:hypothetical protein